MRNPILACLLMALAASCGGGGSEDPADARPTPDSMPSSVTMVACTGSPQTITTPGNMYSPMTVTIAPGEMVRFMLGGSHNVESTTSGVQFGLGFGANACLRFDSAGTYTFKCSPHNFTGSVVVQ